MTNNTKKKEPIVKLYAVVIGIVYAASQHSFYLAGHFLSDWFKVMPPFLPKIPLDDMIPIVSVFIIPYVWSYLYWAMAPMAVSVCEKQHFADYMAANLVACVAGTLALAFFPTYMDRVAEGLYEVAENPSFFAAASSAISSGCAVTSFSIETILRSFLIKKRSIAVASAIASTVQPRRSSSAIA